MCNLKRQLLASVACAFYLGLITVSEQCLLRDASPPWLMVDSAFCRDGGALWSLNTVYFLL